MCVYLLSKGEHDVKNRLAWSSDITFANDPPYTAQESMASKGVIGSRPKDRWLQ